MKIKKDINQDTVIEVKEDFMPYGTKTLDSKDRITLGGRLKDVLGNKMKFEGFMVYLGKNGDILLRPSVSVPSSEAWIYNNPEASASIRKGLKQAAEGKLERVKDLEGFLGKL